MTGRVESPSLSRPVEELQALCDAATPGPWTTKNDDVIGPDGAAVAVVCDSWDGNARRFDDRDFIAAARTALPALLARLRAAEETLAAVGALAEEWRYKGEFGWGAWQEGHGPDQEGHILDECSGEIRAILTDGTPR